MRNAVGAALVLSCALAACSAHGAVPQAAAQQRAVRATIRVRFPRPELGHARHDPHYVSAATKTVTFALTAVNGGGVPAGYTTSQSVSLSYEGSNSSCTYGSGSQSYTCTTSWIVPAASDTFTVKALDASSNVVSTNALTQTVSSGSSTIAVTLWGVPKSVRVSAPSSVLGSSSQGYTLPALSTGYAMTAAAVDADGYTIVGSGSPSFGVAVSPSSNFTLVTPAPQSGSFTIAAGSQASYQTATLTVTASYPATGPTPYPTACPSSSCSTSVSVIAGSPLFVAAQGGVSIYTAQQIAQALGGASPAAAMGKLSVTGSRVQEMAFDGAGDLLALDASSATHVFSYATVASSITSTGSASGTFSSADPLGIALDSANDAFVTNDSSNDVGVYAAASLTSALGGSTGLSPTGTLATGSSPRRAVFDSSGNLYVANEGSNTVSVFSASAVASALGGSTAVAATGTLTGVSEAEGLAFDSSGDLWATSESADAYVFSPSALAEALAGTSTAPTGSLTTAGDTTAVLFDSAGDAFFTIDGESEVQVYPASAVASAAAGNTVSTTPGSLATEGTEPHRLIMDPAGDLFVSDAGQNVVDVFSAAKVESAVSGTTSVARTSTLESVEAPYALAFLP